MSSAEINDSTDSSFQTPDSIIVLEEGLTHEELEPERKPELEAGDIGVSPVLGPFTRSGRKMKNATPAPALAMQELTKVVASVKP